MRASSLSDMQTTIRCWFPLFLVHELLVSSKSIAWRSSYYCVAWSGCFGPEWHIFMWNRFEFIIFPKWNNPYDVPVIRLFIADRNSRYSKIYLPKFLLTYHSGMNELFEHEMISWNDIRIYTLLWITLREYVYKTCGIVLKSFHCWYQNIPHFFPISIHSGLVKLEPKRGL